MSAAVSYERVRDQLATLGLEAALTSIDPVLARGQQDQKVAAKVLDELLGVELAARFERRIATNRKLSGLPTLKTLESFDFAAQPEIPKPTVDELETLRFLHQGENVLLLGPCGVGRTLLATGLALTARARGQRIYFLTMHDLVTKSRATRDRNRLGLFMQTLLRPAHLILDEIGYQPLDRHDATCLFELVNKRYQMQKSIILTSNESFGPWDENFPDTALATALLDRLLHRATTITIRGESYRLRHRRQAGLAGHPSTREGLTPPHKSVYFSAAVDSVHFQTAVDKGVRYTPESHPTSAPKLGPALWPEARILKARPKFSSGDVQATVDSLSWAVGE